MEMPKMKKYPLISIGVPVFNEGRFLYESLKSILAQDYPNFEVIISDNASTDETESICRKYVLRNKKISYFRFLKNKGIVLNFFNTLNQAKGHYFMWAAGHDLWSENYISACIRLLEYNTNAVLAFGCSEWIDAEGKKLPKMHGWTDTRGMTTIARFFSVFWGNMHPAFGVFRTKILKEAWPKKPPAGGDLLILSDIVLKGDFLHAVDAKWMRRDYRLKEKYSDKIKRYRGKDFKVVTSFFDQYFPLVRLPIEIVRIVFKSRISRFDKLFIFLILIPSFPIKYLIGIKS